MAIRFKREVLSPAQKRQQQSNSSSNFKNFIERKVNLNKDAKDIETQLKQGAGGSVQEQNNFIAKLDPNIRRRIKFNPNQEQQKRIDAIEKRLNIVKQDIINYDTEGDNSEGSTKDKYKAKEAGAKTEAQILEKYLGDLKSGKIIETSELLTYAKAVGKNTEKEKEVKYSNRRTQQEVRKITKSNSSVKMITNPEKWLDFQSDKILNSNNRRQLREQIVSEYGNNAFNAANELANQKRDYKTITKSDLDKIYKKLEDKTIAVDNSTSATVFKASVNNALAYEFEQPLPLSASLDKYNERLKKLEEDIKNNETKLRSSIVKNITTQTANFSNKSFKELTNKEKSILQNKFLTGQSVTPKEQKLQEELIKEQNKKLTKSQIQNGKNFILAPVNYGKNLVVRFENGEKNPFLNDVTNFSKGVGKGLKQIFVDPIVDSYEYGTKLVKRAEKNNTSANKILKQDIKKLSSTIKDGTTFAAKNPIATGLIVGAAVGAGLSLTKKEYKKNPAQTLGVAVAYLFPGTLIKTGGKIVRADKAYQKLMQVKKYSKNSFKVSQSLTTGKLKVQGDIKGDLLVGGKFNSKYTLNYNPTTKTYTGSIKTTARKETITQKLKFKDEGAYYLDEITGEKFPKSKLPITQRNIKIKETTIEPKSRTTLIQNNNVLFKDEADIKVVLTSILNNTKTVTQRNSSAVKLIDAETKKVIKAIANQFSKTSKKTKVAKPKKINKKEEKALEDFLKSIQYDKELLNGLDKRKRLAIALGLRKDSKLIKAIEQIVTQDGKVKVIVREAKAVLKGNITTGTKPIKKVKLKTTKFNLKKNKKGSFNLIENSQIQTTKTKNGKLVKDYIEIPTIKVKIPTTKLGLKNLGILRAYNKIQTNLKEISKLQKVQNLVSQKQIQTLAQEIKQEVKKINAKVQKQTPVTKQTQTTKTSNKLIQRNTNLTKKVSRTPTTRTPKLPKTPVKTPKTPKINFDWNSKPPKGYNWKVVGFVNVKGKKTQVTKQLPPNKAFKQLFTTGNKKYRGVDNSTTQSFEFEIVGITKDKDIKKPKEWAKVTKSKKSSKAVLRLKEKSKARIDTKGEKKGLSIAKKTKKKVSKKTQKKTLSKKQAKSKKK